MESPAGGLCSVPYHALNCASSLNYITVPYKNV